MNFGIFLILLELSKTKKLFMFIQNFFNVSSKIVVAVDMVAIITIGYRVDGGGRKERKGVDKKEMLFIFLLFCWTMFSSALNKKITENVFQRSIS